MTPPSTDTVTGAQKGARELWEAFPALNLCSKTLLLGQKPILSLWEELRAAGGAVGALRSASPIPWAQLSLPLIGDFAAAQLQALGFHVDNL